MPAAPASAEPALEADLTSILATNLVAYQALASEYRVTSRQRLKHAAEWLAVVFQRNTRSRRLQALDIGCADGSHAYLLAAHGYDVTGVDFSPRMIQIARWRLQRFRLRKDHRPRFLTGEFHAGTFHDAAGRTELLGDRQFDLVVANAFVHLFPRPYDRAVVKKALDLVAFQGTALFSTTIEDSREEGYFVKYRSDGTGVDRWRGHYPKDEFLALIRDAAGEPFDLQDATSTDMRGRSWLTIAARRARVG
ncbi:class I SAM-dependent methyltransferase [Promicromonospora kroppenstedtii]|uniref:Class I SAM-dependent methyltransferase n=1 Tax=Promicromonospora kroppenstedtii TaxID=440482 RepID=A0ABW7XG14_9MICO